MFNGHREKQLRCLKGPSSLLYGQGDSLVAWINSVSKLPKAEQQGEIWGQLGSS